MAKDKKYSGLHIDFDIIPTLAERFCCENNIEYVKIEKTTNSQIVGFTIVTKQTTFVVDFFISKGDRCTASYKRGTDHETSQKFIDFIIERQGIVNNTNDNKGFSIDIVEKDFDAFYELISDEDVFVSDHMDNGNEIFNRLTSKRYGDTIIIHYYRSTNKLFIQGRRLELFDKAIEILSGKCPLKEVVNSEIRYSNVSITSDSVLDYMKEVLGDVYDYLTNTQKAMMSNSFMFYRVGMESLDYSILVQPMCRAMEGYILKVLVHNNVNNDDGNRVGFFFKSEDAQSNPLELHSQYVNDVNNDEIVNEVNRLYKWYHKNRHQYSHSTDIDATTAIIKDRKVADNLFKEAVELFKKSYEVVVNAKK